MSFSLTNITNGLQRGAMVVGAFQGLLPILGALVRSAENLFPQAGSGAQKLSHVQGVVSDILQFSGHALADVEALLPAITSVVNNIVAAAKAPIQAPPVTP